MSNRRTTFHWSHSTAPLPKKRRAGLVCITCHERKVRCDLATAHARGLSGCTSCIAAGQDCHARVSRRGLRQASRSAKSHKDVSLSKRTSAEPRSEEITDAERGHTSLQAQALRQTASSLKATHPHQDLLEDGFDLENQNFEAAVAPDSAPVNIASNPSIRTTASMTQSHEGDIDGGFLQVFAPEFDKDNQLQSLMSNSTQSNNCDTLKDSMLQIFTETYFEYCYTFCPILERSTIQEELARSSLLSNALAIVGSQVRPPLNSVAGPGEYYRRARQIFHDDGEVDAFITLKSLLLFYWWAPRSSSTVHRHSSWYWTSSVIRQGQQMDLHRKPTSKQLSSSGISVAMRRRIWWTAFSRERLIALSASKPAIISLKDCTLGLPTLADFPEATDDPSQCTKAELFIQWVQLSIIIGKIAKYLSRTGNASKPFPQDMANSLIDWIRGLPPHLELPIDSSPTNAFNREIYQLHLPYLAAIIILHLHKSDSSALPIALPPAVFAATCVARIFDDILARGDICFLPSITSWYSSIAFIALLNASTHSYLSSAAEADIGTITLTVDRLRRMWASAEVIYEGISRLKTQAQESASGVSPQPNSPTERRKIEELLLHTSPHRASGNENEEVPWMDYFPFASARTTDLASALLAAEQRWGAGGERESSWMPEYTDFNLQDWFVEFECESDLFMGANASGF